MFQRPLPILVIMAFYSKDVLPWGSISPQNSSDGTPGRIWAICRIQPSANYYLFFLFLRMALMLEILFILVNKRFLILLRQNIRVHCSAVSKLLSIFRLNSNKPFPGYRAPVKIYRWLQSTIWWNIKWIKQKG